MSDRRVRLTDDDIALIVAALRARAAMTTGLRAHRLERLATRLSEGGRGNPKWRLGEAEQTHEENLDTEDDKLDDRELIRRGGRCRGGWAAWTG